MNENPQDGNHLEAGKIATEEPQVTNNKNPKRRKLIWITSLALILLTLLIGLYWFFYLRWEESTDDAYVDGYMITLSPQVQGSVTAFYADDTDKVVEGQLIVQIDPTDYLLAFEQEKVSLALAVRQVSQLIQEVKQREADVNIQKARLERTKQDLENRLKLRGTKSLSKEDYEHASADFRAQEAALIQSERLLDSAKANLGTTNPLHHPLIEQEKVRLRNAFVNLQRCKVLAPTHGFVAKRNVEVGEWITPGTPLMNIIPLDDVWIYANYKETQLQWLREGQPVDIEADIYGRRVIYKGKIEGILGGSGSVFSLLPPQNATGNWIKIVQRVPVKVTIDKEQLKDFPLLLGLSVYTTASLRDTSGPFLSLAKRTEKVAATNIYDISFTALNETIEEIIQQNFYDPNTTTNTTENG
ncbi:Multidrug resistance protein MdtN [Candidatus Rubidus massiliensis]|nr:Multidrug resistance protein MdtN [Candidatus Rubidus massiliensis]